MNEETKVTAAPTLAEKLGIKYKEVDGLYFLVWVLRIKRKLNCSNLYRMITTIIWDTYGGAEGLRVKVGFRRNL